jgi:hypothetical protein
MILPGEGGCMNVYVVDPFVPLGEMGVVLWHRDKQSAAESAIQRTAKTGVEIAARPVFSKSGAPKWQYKLMLCPVGNFISSSKVRQSQMQQI